MLPKKNRVDTKTVEKIFRRGRSLSSSNLSFKFIVNGINKRVSFIAPKSISKSAVQRNYLRRIGYTALGKNLNLCPAGIAGIFVFKKYQDNISILQDEIKNIFSKIS